LIIREMTMMPKNIHNLNSQLRKELGVSLMFALIALISLAFAALALVRSVDTGSLVIGNIGFKQDATAGSELVANEAIAWVAARNSGTTLNADDTANGYFASSLDVLDPTGNGTIGNSRVLVDWNKDDCAYAASGTYANCISPSAAATYGTNTGRWVITRLCTSAGPPSAANSCAVPLTKVSTETGGGEVKYGGGVRFTPGSGGPFYRIIVRNVGARGTVSFTETIAYF
jgi:type IV pilus assembly protein PilX